MAKEGRVPVKKYGPRITSVKKSRDEQMKRDIIAAEKRRLAKKRIGKAKRAAK